jgi:hypothetical protein
MPRRCANGHENPDDYEFCGECGSPIEEPASVACPNGHENLPGQAYCGTCGAPLSDVAAVHEASSNAARRTGASGSRLIPGLVVAGWLVVAAIVLGLALISYQAHYAFEVMPTSNLSNPNPAPQTLQVTISCHGPIVERFSEVKGNRVADAVNKAADDASVSRSQTTNTVLPFATVRRELHDVCQGPATPRLIAAGGLLIAALIGTWLFFNLTRSKREAEVAD